jgi:tetratricopeptide (TPR) repeat protein
MTRAGSYGQSFALKALAEGKAEAALAEAERVIAAEPENPEPVLDRAQIHCELARWEAALADLARAVELDKVALVLDDSVVDDTLFTTLLGWAQEVAPRDATQAVAILGRYATLAPAGQGTHHDDAARWMKRFQGHVETWVKPHDD